MWHAAASSILFTSLFSAPPSLVKNFIPLRLYGRWLAVSMIAPSALISSNTVVMNIAGVDASPQSMTLAPRDVSPPIAAFFSSGPETRESRPIVTFMSDADRPVFFSRKSMKPIAIRHTASGVRFTGSSATPATATPRTSLPFCKRNNPFSVAAISNPPCL